MDSDNDSYHSENEFYYPDEENVLQENKNIVISSNDTSADEEISTIQDFIEAQRPLSSVVYIDICFFSCSNYGVK